jgi:hypothetical protein
MLSFHSCNGGSGLTGGGGVKLRMCAINTQKKRKETLLHTFRGCFHHCSPEMAAQSSCIGHRDPLLRQMPFVSDVIPTRRPVWQQVVAVFVAVWDDVRIVLEKFANCSTGSEYFQWVRRLREQNVSEHQSRGIALRFAGHARITSKGSMLICHWGN